MLVYFFKALINKIIFLRPSAFPYVYHSSFTDIESYFIAQKVLLPFFMALFMLLSGDVLPQTVALLVTCFQEYEYVSWHKL